MNLRTLVIGIRESSYFSFVTTGIILLYAVFLGLKTMDGFQDSVFEQVVLVLDYFVTIYFLVEIVIKLSAEEKMINFFKDGWNVFDFIIVLITIIPLENTDYAAVARLFRIFRVLRLVTARPQLKHLITVLLGTIPAIFDILLLLFIVFYIYSVLGSLLFVSVDTKLWGDFLLSMLTLFKILTLEGWADIMDSVMEVYPWAWVYFVSFIVIASFVLFNFFIAIIIDKMQKEHEDKGDKKIDMILEKLDRLEQRLDERVLEE